MKYFIWRQNIFLSSNEIFHVWRIDWRLFYECIKKYLFWEKSNEKKIQCSAWAKKNARSHQPMIHNNLPRRISSKRYCITLVCATRQSFVSRVEPCRIMRHIVIASAAIIALCRYRIYKNCISHQEEGFHIGVFISHQGRCGGVVWRILFGRSGFGNSRYLVSILVRLFLGISPRDNNN